MLAWLSVWSEVQTCILPSWCHCHSLSLASVESRLVLPFWYRLTWVVPDKGPLYGCMHFSYMDFSLNSLDVIQKGLLCRHSLRCCWLLTVVGFNERWRFSKKYIIKFTGTCSVVCWWLKKLWDSVCGWEGHQKFATLTPLKYQMLLADPRLIEKLSLNH